MSIKIIIFGDSIAWGADDREKQGWASRLRNFYEKSSRRPLIYNCAISGDSTKEVLLRFDIETVGRLYEYDEKRIVIFAIGINDSQHFNEKGNYETPIDVFGRNIRELINKAKQKFDEIIFVGITHVDEAKTKPIPWLPSVSYDNESIERYNEVIRNICSELNIKFIDIYEVVGYDEMEDGVHPNADGHEKLFKVIQSNLDI